MSTTISTCRACGNHDLVQALHLGSTPLANALLESAQLQLPERTYPLELVLCRHCSLLQLREGVPPEELFQNYLYFSSFSQTMVEHARLLAEEMIARLELGRTSLVMEAASNDGYLLQHYLGAGVAVIGIEPAHNIADVARDRAIPTLATFFGLDLAIQLRMQGNRANVFHAHNVLAHVPDLNGFVAGIQLLLAEDGIAVLEVPYVKDLIEGCEFDTIYHEHLCYFSLTALDHLIRRHNLQILDVRRVPIHGGSLRLYVGQREAKIDSSPAVEELLNQEAQWGVRQLAVYHQLGRRIEDLKQSLREMLSHLRREGKRVVAYGASAKGSTLLNYFEIGQDILDYVVDRSTVKQGRYTPGTHLPICSPTRLLEDMPDYVLLLTWNFADEIMQQQHEYRQRGGKFITPIPELKVA